MNKPRILVCGGRDYDDYRHVARTLDSICAEREWIMEPDEFGNWLPQVVIIHGGARGADCLADQWAVVNWQESVEFPADWKRHGKMAGPIRNLQMLEEGKPDLVVAFPGGRGTAHMVKAAEERGIEVIRA